MSHDLSSPRTIVKHKSAELKGTLEANKMQTSVAENFENNWSLLTTLHLRLTAV